MTLVYKNVKVSMNGNESIYLLPVIFISTRNRINEFLEVLEKYNKSERSKQVLDIRESVQILEKLFNEIDPSLTTNLYDTRQPNETNFENRKIVMTTSYSAMKAVFNSLKNGWYKTLIEKTPQILLTLDDELKDIQKQLQDLLKEVKSFVIPDIADKSEKETFISKAKDEFSKKLDHIINDLTVPWETKHKTAVASKEIDSQIFAKANGERHLLQKKLTQSIFNLGNSEPKQKRRSIVQGTTRGKSTSDVQPDEIIRHIETWFRGLDNIDTLESFQEYMNTDWTSIPKSVKFYFPLPPHIWHVSKDTLQETQDKVNNYFQTNEEWIVHINKVMQRVATKSTEPSKHLQRVATRDQNKAPAQKFTHQMTKSDFVVNILRHVYPEFNQKNDYLGNVMLFCGLQWCSYWMKKYPNKDHDISFFPTIVCILCVHVLKMIKDISIDDYVIDIAYRITNSRTSNTILSEYTKKDAITGKKLNLLIFSLQLEECYHSLLSILTQCSFWKVSSVKYNSLISSSLAVAKTQKKTAKNIDDPICGLMQNQHRYLNMIWSNLHPEKSNDDSDDDPDDPDYEYTADRSESDDYDSFDSSSSSSRSDNDSLPEAEPRDVRNVISAQPEQEIDLNMDSDTGLTFQNLAQHDNTAAKRIRSDDSSSEASATSGGTRKSARSKTGRISTSVSVSRTMDVAEDSPKPQLNVLTGNSRASPKPKNQREKASASNKQQDLKTSLPDTQAVSNTKNQQKSKTSPVDQQAVVNTNASRKNSKSNKKGGKGN